MRKLLAVLLLFSAQTMAVTPYVMSIGVGTAWNQANNGLIHLSFFETDLAQSKQETQQALYLAGIGYLRDLNTNRFFLNQILVDLTFYHSSGSVKGEVLQASRADMNNYSFQAPFQSNRLMLDVKPYLCTISVVSPYAIIGIGNGWNYLSYSDTPRLGTVEDSGISLLSQSSQHIAWDFGGGLQFQISEHGSIALQYLYTLLGTLSSSVRSNQPATPVPLTPILFNIHSQAVMATFHWAM